MYSSSAATVEAIRNAARPKVDEYFGFLSNTREFVEKGDILLMERMLRDGSVPSADVKYNSSYALTRLARSQRDGSKEAMEWLLTRQAPANINLDDSNGQTALHISAESMSTSSNSPGKVRLLLEFGADRNIRDRNDHTPIECAKFQIRFQRNAIIEENIRILETYFPDTSVASLEAKRKGLRSGAPLPSNITNFVQLLP